MGKKQHWSLCSTFESRFPSLFNFEYCGLILVDAEHGHLLKYLKEYEIDLDESQIMEEPVSVLKMD